MISPSREEFRALADDNVRALFRNDLSGPLTVVFIVSQVLTYCLAAYALTNRRMRWGRTSAFLLLAAATATVSAVEMASLYTAQVPLDRSEDDPRAAALGEPAGCAA